MNDIVTLIVLVIGTAIWGRLTYYGVITLALAIGTMIAIILASLFVVFLFSSGMSGLVQVGLRIVIQFAVFYVAYTWNTPYKRKKTQ